MPSASVGTSAPPSSAFLAASGAITPSMRPRPKVSGIAGGLPRHGVGDEGGGDAADAGHHADHRRRATMNAATCPSISTRRARLESPGDNEIGSMLSARAICLPLVIRARISGMAKRPSASGIKRTPSSMIFELQPEARHAFGRVVAEQRQENAETAGDQSTHRRTRAQHADEGDAGKRRERNSPARRRRASPAASPAATGSVSGSRTAPPRAEAISAAPMA